MTRRTVYLFRSEATADAIERFLIAEQQLKQAQAAVSCIRTRIGASIRRRRRALDLSGSALGRIARVNESELSKLERGRLSRGIALARKVDAALSAIERERVQMRQARAS